MLKPEICLGVVLGFILFFGGPFTLPFASLDLAFLALEIMTDVGAVGVVRVAVSADRKLVVGDLLLVALGGTVEELVKGCPIPAERFLAACASVTLW